MCIKLLYISSTSSSIFANEHACIQVQALDLGSCSSHATRGRIQHVQTCNARKRERYFVAKTGVAKKHRVKRCCYRHYSPVQYFCCHNSYSLLSWRWYCRWQLGIDPYSALAVGSAFIADMTFEVGLVVIISLPHPLTANHGAASAVIQGSWLLLSLLLMPQPIIQSI
jgi:hypothetical protein